MDPSVDAARLEAEFLAVVAEAAAPLDHPDMRAFRVVGATVAPGRAHVAYVGEPTGPRDDPQRSYVVDRRLVVGAAALTMARRAGRLAAGDDCGDWNRRLDARFPGWFACEVSCNAGWADLVFALAERVEVEHPGPAFRFKQVKQKFGQLRAYRADPDEQIGGIVEAFTIVSGAVCEACGAPGALRATRTFPTHTACDLHARGNRVFGPAQGVPR